jgi:hypothetical protein
VDDVEDEGGGRGEDYVSRLGALVARSLFSRCHFSSPVCTGKPLPALASLLLLPSSMWRVPIAALWCLWVPHHGVWGRRDGDRELELGLELGFESEVAQHTHNLARG